MEFENRNHRKTDIVKDIIFFFLTTVFAFAYFMLVLLIISFITTSYLHFTIEGIFIASILGAVGVGVYYIVKKVKIQKAVIVDRTEGKEYFKK